MRQIGSLPQQLMAERLAAYLITRGISATAEQDGDAWLIWVRDEDQLEAAQAAFEEFLADPDDLRYRGVVREAAERLQQEARQRDRARRNFVSMSQRWRRAESGSIPLVRTVIGLCVLIFVMINLGGARTTVERSLAFCDPTHQLDPNWNADLARDRAIDLRHGQLWRLVTPAFMHADPWHLLFNMIWFYLFASQIERRKGPWRLLLLILGTAALSNGAQGLAPTSWGALGGTHRFLGLSGVVYGLLGYLWIKTLHDPSSGLFVSSGTVVFMVIWLMLGVTGVLESMGMPPMANLAHIVGLLSGMGFAYLPLLRP